MKPKFVRLSQALFFLNAAIWVLFGLISLARLAQGNSPNQMMIMKGIIAGLMFGNAAAMLICGLLLAKRQKRGYCLAVLVLTINIILSVTDQFGWMDLITMLFDLALLGLLIANRKNFILLTAGIVSFCLLATSSLCSCAIKTAQQSRDRLILSTYSIASPGENMLFAFQDELAAEDGSLNRVNLGIE
jgi:hypothetical protein